MDHDHPKHDLNPMSHAGKGSGNSKEWKLIEDLLSRSFKEQVRARRWGILFKSLTFLYLFVVLLLVLGQRIGGVSTRENHTAVIDVEGMIAADKPANAEAIGHALQAAFESSHAQGILLRINSPGGSPVQAALIFDEIQRLRKKFPEKKVYAVISDMGTSGAYYIAAAADEIYANDSSLVGSIGVISMNFGFTELMDKVGVERRVFTAGQNKALLDPFLPLKGEEVAHFREVLGYVHKQFIDRVKRGRGDRLSRQDLFNGLLWTGEQSVELGLIDGLASAEYVAREIIGEEKMVNYTPKLDPLQAIAGRLGASVTQAILSELSVPRLQ
ncbi:MAG: S49 family peptidase [Gammaproteobacteria bacterium]